VTLLPRWNKLVQRKSLTHFSRDHRQRNSLHACSESNFWGIYELVLIGMSAIHQYYSWSTLNLTGPMLRRLANQHNIMPEFLKLLRVFRWKLRMLTQVMLRHFSPVRLKSRYVRYWILLSQMMTISDVSRIRLHDEVCRAYWTHGLRAMDYAAVRSLSLLRHCW
jgi:hypothetical protein